MNNANIPASSGPIYSVDADGTQVFVRHGTGFTKREELAARAMQGMLSNPEWPTPESVSEDAVMAADALLAELEKEPNQ